MTSRLGRGLEHMSTDTFCSMRSSCAPARGRRVVDLGGPRPAAGATIQATLIYTMSVSANGFIAICERAFGWSAPSEELFRFHFALASELGGRLLGRRLDETTPVWETHRRRANRSSGPRSPTSGARSRRSSPAARSTEYQGNARLAEASLAEEDRRGARPNSQVRRGLRRRLGRAGDRARPRRRAAHALAIGRRRWRHAVPAAGH